MSEQVVEPRARMAYVLGQFPSVSETFILREMCALRGLGFDLTPISMNPPAELVHEAAQGFARRTLYRPRPISWLSAKSLVSAFFRKPVGCMSSLRMVITYGLRDFTAVRELLSAHVAACYVVANVPPGHMRHVHAHFASYPATVGLLLAEILGVGFSMSCHARDIYTDETRLMSAKVAEAEFVTVCTEAGAERLQRKYTPLDSDKLKMIRHGLDFDEFKIGPHRDHKVPLVLSVGRLVEKKGFPILLRAAAMLAADGLDFELAIIGDGPQREELEQLINGLGLQGRVHLSGYLTQKEIMAAYRYADLFVLTPIVAPDGDRDGLPNTIIEAMAAGIPVVATDVGAISELVVDEETGLLAESGNVQQIARCMERALVDQQLRETVSARGLQRVRREYDINRNVGQLGSLFAEVLHLRRWPPISGATRRLPQET